AQKARSDSSVDHKSPCLSGPADSGERWGMHPRETMLADGAAQPQAPSHQPRSAQSAAAAADGPMAPEAFTALTQRIMAVMNTVIDGKEESVRLALTVLL